MGVAHQLMEGWTEKISKEVLATGVDAKIRNLNLVGYSSSVSQKQVLSVIGLSYPVLITAMPDQIVAANPNADPFADDSPHAQEDKTVVPEISKSGTNEANKEKIGITIHELSHYFGGDFMNMNVLERIKGHVTFPAFLEFIVASSKSVEKYMNTIYIYF